MTGATPDPASLQVLISRLIGVAEEMGAVLQRSMIRVLNTTPLKDLVLSSR